VYKRRLATAVTELPTFVAAPGRLGQTALVADRLRAQLRARFRPAPVAAEAPGSLIGR
jgi:hypothetical protein